MSALDLNTPAGTLVRLEPISRKGRNRIHEAGGDLWEVVAAMSRDGWPSLLVSPVNVEGRRHDRWVRIQGDLDFKIAAVTQTSEEAA